MRKMFYQVFRSIYFFHKGKYICHNFTGNKSAFLCMLFSLCPTCDNEFSGRGAELSLACESVLGPAFVGLESIVRAHFSDLELARGQHHVFPV